MTCLTMVLAAKALGTGIGLIYVTGKDWFDARWVRRQPINTAPPSAVNYAIFYDKEYILNLAQGK